MVARCLYTPVESDGGNCERRISIKYQTLEDHVVERFIAMLGDRDVFEKIPQGPDLAAERRARAEMEMEMETSPSPLLLATYLKQRSKQQQRRLEADLSVESEPRPDAQIRSTGQTYRRTWDGAEVRP